MSLVLSKQTSKSVLFIRLCDTGFCHDKMINRYLQVNDELRTNRKDSYTIEYIYF